MSTEPCNGQNDAYGRILIFKSNAVFLLFNFCELADWCNLGGILLLT